LSEKKVFKLPPRYANRESLTQSERHMIDMYNRFADENGVEITYDKELDVALVIFTPNY
jgi:hypothetical protein